MGLRKTERHRGQAGSAGYGLTTRSPHQLTLAVSLPDSASFENFYAAVNREVVSALNDFATAGEYGPSAMHLFGDPGNGKTHLLYATVRRARERRLPSCYVDAGEKHVRASMLSQIKGDGLVCVDDLDAVAGRHDRERELLQLYERTLIEGGRLLTAAVPPIRHLGLELPDLMSRLLSAAAYRVAPLNDEQKRVVLKARAMSRGILLSDEVLEYVLRRYPRDTHALFALLERIDNASLSAKRRVTIPFLQELEES